MQPTHTVSVSGITTDDKQRVLVIRRRDNDQWQAPGGMLEPGERIEDGLVREVREETGITVKPIRLTGVYNNVKLNVVALTFRCELVSGSEQASEETAEVRWMTREEIEKEMVAAFAVRVLDALGDTSQVAVRTNDGVNLL